MAKARTSKPTPKTATPTSTRRRKGPTKPAEETTVTKDDVKDIKVVDLTTQAQPAPKPFSGAPKKAASSTPATRTARHHRTMGDIVKRAKAMRGARKKVQFWMERTDDKVALEKFSTAASEITSAVESLDNAAQALADIPATYRTTTPHKASVGVGSTVRFKSDFAEDFLEYFVDTADETFEIVKQLKGHKKFLGKNKDGNVCKVVRGQIEPAEPKAGAPKADDDDAATDAGGDEDE